MKQVIKIFMLALVLMLFSVIYILFTGNTHSLEYYIDSSKDYTLSVENEFGEIEILDEKKTDNKYIVKVKAKKPGRVFVSLINDDFQKMDILYIHKNLVITNNNFFGKSRGSEVIPISITIFLSYILYILIRKYNYYKRENLYQYKNIAYLGIIIFTINFLLINFISIFNYRGIDNTIHNVINSSGTFSFFLFPLALITFILVSISNLNLIRKEGFSFKRLLGVILGLFVCGLTLLPNYLYEVLLYSQKINIYNLNSIGPYIYDFVETMIYISIAYLECILIGTIILAIKSIKKKITYDKDYVIILGCKIKKDGSLTPLLKGRVDRALKFRKEQLESTNKDLIFIPSGGKGNDEIISEAEAIRNYLKDQGIKDKNIIIENKSKNTYENIKFSNKLIKKKNAKIIFSTTNYHVLRAGLIATEQGILMEGIGSKTKAYFWINAFIRECIGTLYTERKKHIIIFILIALLLLIMIYITYISNNI